MMEEEKKKKKKELEKEKAILTIIRAIKTLTANYSQKRPPGFFSSFCNQEQSRIAIKEGMIGKIVNAFILLAPQWVWRVPACQQFFDFGT